MKDLTKGNPVLLILQFAVPIGLGNIFQLFYNLADTRIIGSCLGESALAAVGSTNSLNSMIIGFLMGMTNGFAIVVARRFGAKNEDELKNAVAVTLILGILASLVLTVFSVFFLKDILLFLNTPDNLLEDAMDYFRIILLGMTASMLYNVTSGILRSIGDTVTPLCFLVGSTICNIVLDLVFILVFDAGVKGAALATVVSQILSFILCMIYMWVKYPILRLRGRDFHLTAGIVKEMYAIGLSMGLMISFINVGSVALQTQINTFGDNIIVAHTAARKLTEFFMLPFTVLATAMATYCGQNLGAGQYARIRQGIMAGLKLSFAWSVVVLLVAYTIVPYLVRLVTGTDVREIIDTASLYLRVDTLLYAVTAVIIIVRNAMQGIGDSITPIVSSGIELLSKVAVAVLLAPALGYWAIILAEPISWVLMVIPLLRKLRTNPILRGEAA